MNIFKTNKKIKTISIVIGCIFLALVPIIWWYWATENNKLSAILSSLIAGLVIGIIQLIIAYQDYKQTEKLKELKLIEVLYNRDNREFYKNFIKQAQQNIKIMGVTARRFFEHFADDDINASADAKVLLEVLSRNIDVKILLPASDYVDEDKKNDVLKVRRHIEKIKEDNPNYLLNVKYFEHTAAHSIFNVDDECIVGPVFPEVESKHTPALHLRSSSPLAKKYLSYFEDEWKKAIQ